MQADTRVLTVEAARTYYDRFGKKQDSQGFYEDCALDALIAGADFQNCHHVFEFGCGTGRLAARLLEGCLSSSASYVGCDVSRVMANLAKHRLAAFAPRAQVALSDGDVRFDVPDQSVDRVVSTYVLDLLSEADVSRFFAESQRVLDSGGRVCLAGLTRGAGGMSRLVSSIWMLAFRLNPALVGGCRPIQLDAFVNSQDWKVMHRKVVTPFGVPSEVLILQKTRSPN